ncbi:MAG: DOPA 4,5-dioxygenase family protein [Gammaproteobacteria bacterium]|nr:DOPA 4,5-dioxygenase family protein [Gammaproteobacteria bacterium]NIR82075.1 DOPA 4,5-dioxygenase family protein [Gammaproteobacteria bacterium]NIR89303.1 DOPA 4,5-dioxygenase family protein [Gammaproteobacteria bacterium]NIU03185.1 DOPA 4,5-dioxygenase family protein [Gammaproteobacteria bacterium]NIV50701.1 4,5-dioxygenase [Gammaproteobacteria bacterium]
MSTSKLANELSRIAAFHAHVYYTSDSKQRAARVRERIAARFDVQLGRWHDEPIGPHPFPSYQVAFAPELFGTLVPWLALNREGLVIFVHPETGNDLADHADHAVWMGGMPELELGIFE